MQTLLHHISKMGTDRVLVLFGNSFACIQQFCPILTPNVSKGPRADGTWGGRGAMTSQILENPVPLNLPRDYVHQITACPLGLSDLPTALGHKGSPQDNSQLVQSLLIIYNMLPCSSLLTKENPAPPTQKSDNDDNFEKLYLILRFFL